MSRNAVILLVVLCAAVAGILVLSKKRAPQGDPVPVAQNTDVPTTPAGTGSENQNVARPINNNVAVSPSAAPVTVPPATAPGEQGRSAVAAARNPAATTSTRPNQIVPINLGDTNDPPVLKPLPVLEKDYASATNRDTRLDIMMDIAESPGAEAVRALTRLFEIETDPDLKVDLLDSLLGIEGFKEDKLIMLTMGARQGLASEIRQSAIDGLIDLDDARVIPVLNGLLNDPDPDIREGAQDALEMLQAQPAPTVKIIQPGIK